MNTAKLMEPNVKATVPQFGQIIVSNEHSRSLSSVYFSNPSPLEERNFGHLFMVIDMQNTEREMNQKILSFLEQEIRHAYYYSELFSADTAFEQALQEINQKIQSLVPELGSDWIHQTNILVGVISNQTLHLSSAGKIHAFLIQHDRIIDIIDQQNINSFRHPNRLFGNVISGEISPKNALLFCTASFLDYFSLEKLKKTISGVPLEKSTDQMNQLLSDNENNDSFGGILLKLQPIEAPADSGLKDQSTTVIQKLNQEIAHRAEIDSMHQLVHKEQATSELLTPSLWPVIKKNLKSLSDASSNFFKDRLSAQSPLKPRSIDHDLPLHTPFRPQAAKVSSNPNSATLKSLIIGIVKILKYLTIKFLTVLVFLGRFILQWFNPRSRYHVKSQVRSLPNQALNRFSRLFYKFKSLSRPRQLLLILAVFFIFLFAQSIINIGKRNEQSTQAAAWAEAFEKVKVNLVEAEAAMNYQNEEGALTFLTNASDLLASVPDEAKNLQSQKGEFRQQINKLQSQIQNITIVDAPTLFSDLTLIHPEIQVSHLALRREEFIGFDTHNGSVYRISASPSTLISATEPASPILATSAAEEDDLLLLRSDGSISKLHEDAIRPVSVSFQNQDRSILSIAYFSPGRLYSLDQKNKQIFKHSRIEEGFGSGAAWLSDESVNIEDARSMQVDGSIYILKEGGKVIKLFGGKKESFSLSPIQPELSSATKIFTAAETSNLYLLDPNNKRVAVFDKQGKVKAQYTSPTFDDLKDLTVLESQKRLLVLNGQKVFQVELTETAP